jgi:hypothetical protein
MTGAGIEAVRLFAYKMTHDSGFAPSPFWGRLTLATCKPQMRLSKRKGDWIAGFTSGELSGDAVGKERLVYLMQVKERIPLGRYYGDPAFSKKIPKRRGVRHIERLGDNIYRPKHEPACAPGDFEQIPNDSHYNTANCSPDRDAQKQDVSGGFVLVADRFVYFGCEPLNVPAAIRPAVPLGQSAHGWRTKDVKRAQGFIAYVFREARGRRIVAPPWQKWPDGDESWRQFA